MADVDQAIQFVLRLEDSTMSGAVTSTPGDSGGKTRYGLASRWHGDLRVQGYFSAAMANSVALPLAMGVYSQEYAAPLLLTQFSSQAVANLLLSAAVNESDKQGLKLLQQAINTLMPNAVKVDGEPGPFTVAAANRCMEASLLACFRVQTIAFHLSLKQPEFFAGWVRRDLAEC